MFPLVKRVIDLFKISFCLFLAIINVQVLIGRTLVDGVVATVGSHPILHSDVETKVSSQEPIVVSDYPSTDKDSLWVRAMSDAINSVLIIMECEKLGFKVSEEQIDLKLLDIAKRNGLQVSDLPEVLKQQNESMEDLRSDIRKRLLTILFQRKVLMPLVKVSDRELEAFFVKKEGGSLDSTKLILKKIHITADVNVPDSFKEKAKNAEEVYNKLQGGLLFDDAAKLYSLPPVNQVQEKEYELHKLSSTLNDAFKNLKKGQYTKPIKLTDGYYIFYLVDRKQTKKEDFLNNKKNLEMELKFKKMNNEMSKWLKKARSKVKVQLHTPVPSSKG